MFPKVNTPSSLNNWSSELNSTLFDLLHDDEERSAIDSFIAKNTELNKLIIDPTGKLSQINQMIIDGEINDVDGRKIIALLGAPNPNPKFLNLILLGYVSSVEAYIRKLVRDLINLDPFVRKSCERLSIEFGSTFYQEIKMYPESLMDASNFIHSGSIKSECSKFLSISIQKFNSSSLEQAFSEFDSICQLRHCIVHRFGNIGVKNLMSLGMHTELLKDCIEKPISMDFTAIQKASKSTVNLVRELNNAIWNGIMERLRDADPAIWTWDLRSDKAEFKKYLSVFYDSNLGNIDANLTDIYYKYKLTK